jgi:hypothetical protein
MQFFKIYQCLVPLLFLPISYGLWFNRASQTHQLPLFVLGIPFLFAYIIPALGTNWLNLWSFNTNFKWGGMRLYHGFVFGPAASLLALVCIDHPSVPFSTLGLLRSGLVVGSVFAFWNWYYDMLAIKAGFLVVYNRAYHEKQGAAEISSQYAPVFFGSFGFCYGIAIKGFEYSINRICSESLFLPFLFAACLVTCSIPAVLYILYSKLTLGESGLHSFAPQEQNEKL